MKKQIKELDLVRGMAILLILAYHWYVAFYFKPLYINQESLISAFITNFPTSLIPALFLTGYQGVHLFLFLSGFLLTNIYLNHQEGWSQFYKKRLMKLLIPLYPALLLSVLIYYFLNSTGPGLANIASILLMPFSIRFWTNDIWLINSPIWFLGLIIQFYLIFPILLKALKILKPLKFFLLLNLITLISRFAVIYLFDSHPFGVRISTTGGGLAFALMPNRLFELGLGMSLAYLYAKNKHHAIIKKMPAATLLLLSMAFLLWGNIATIFKFGWLISDQLITLGLVTFCLLISVYLVKKRAIRKVFNFTAYYSYEMFLIHYPLIFGIVFFLKKSHLKDYYFVLAIPIVILILFICARLLKSFSKLLKA